jgi:hypothetical protein
MNTYATSKAKTEKKISLSKTATYLIRIPKATTRGSTWSASSSL